MDERLSDLGEPEGKVPKLRFPEFEGDWVERRLGEDCDVMMCKRIFAEQTHENGEVPFFKIGTLGGVADAFISRKLFEEYKAKYKFPKKGEVLITCSGTVGKSLIFDGKSSYFQDSNIVWINNPLLKIENAFLFYILSKVDWASLNSTTITRIYGDDLRNLIIRYPEQQNEQQKVTALLSLIDTRLSTQSKIIAQYQTLMQNLRELLFSQQLRFKDVEGSDFPDWEIDKLGNLGKFFSGGTPLTSNKNYYNGFIPFIKSGEINAYRTEQFISEDGLKNSSAKMIEKGDLIYALYGATSGEVGISKNSGAINQAILCMRTSLNSIYLLNFLQFKKESILKTYLQGGQGNLSAEIIKSLEVPVPSLSEQTRIANFLSSIDEKIEAEKMLLSQYEKQKAYLLQSLFV